MVLGCTEVHWGVTRDTGGRGLLEVLGRKSEFYMVHVEYCGVPRATTAPSSLVVYIQGEKQRMRLQSELYEMLSRVLYLFFSSPVNLFLSLTNH